MTRKETKMTRFDAIISEKKLKMTRKKAKMTIKEAKIST